VDDVPSQRDEALERLGEIGDAEIGQREAIARASATLVQPERGMSLVRLEALAFAFLSLVERDVEQCLPEASGAGQVVSGELDQVEWHGGNDTVSTARCTAGAGVGERLVIEAVEQITLVVSKPGSDLAQNT